MKIFFLSFLIIFYFERNKLKYTGWLYTVPETLI